MTRLRTILLLLALVVGGTGSAQPLPDAFHVVGTLPPDRVGQLMARVSGELPAVSLHYRQMGESEIVSMIESPLPPDRPIDLVVLPTPDLGVRLANEGLLDSLPISLEQPDPSHWRQEVFSLFHDPAMIAVRKDAPLPEAALRTRLDLARFLESAPPRFRGRVGLVNIGIDSQSYAYATQDQLRSPLYWRIMRAFGHLDARIYETNAEILDALRNGRIDLAYNLPLSQLVFEPLDEIRIDAFEDYVIALPWVVFAPSPDRNPMTPLVVDLLRDDVLQQRFPPKTFWAPADGEGLTNTQKVKLGPELLVFQDALKKSAILDEWFQSVTRE